MNHGNLFLAMAMSLAILVGFHFFYEQPRMEAYRQTLAQQAAVQKTAKAEEQAAIDAAPKPRDRADIVKATPRIVVASDQLRGSINLKGGRLDDLVLTQYRETVEPNSPPVTLLSPQGSAPPYPAYYAEFGWLGENVKLPDAETVWHADRDMLTQATPVTLSWENGEGLRFERVIALDDQLMFTITDRVRNNGGKTVTLHPYALIAQQGKQNAEDIAMGHTGPMGALGGVLREHGYDNMIDTPDMTEESRGGWVGITSKYWLTALIPPPDEAIAASFKYAKRPEQKPDEGRFQVDYRGAAAAIEPGASHDYTRRIFAGAKRVELLDFYRDKYHIDKFDLAIDFGWFRFLTKPLLYTLNWLGDRIGNVGLAILALTVLVKFLVLPLGIKSVKSMGKMKKLQPELKRLAERHKEDKQRQSVEMMELYKREKVSPLSGCLPILAQLPVFFALYKVLYIGINMRHAPFYGWIRDLSAPDPTTIINLFGLLPFEPPHFLSFAHIGVWPLLMGGSMFALQKMSPAPPDPMQAQVMMLMPILFTFMLGPSMAAGLLIYWTWSNLLSILQQFVIFRRMSK